MDSSSMNLPNIRVGFWGPSCQPVSWKHSKLTYPPFVAYAWQTLIWMNSALLTICPCTGHLDTASGKSLRQAGWYHCLLLIIKHPGCSLLLAISLCLSDLLILLPSEKTFEIFSTFFKLRFVPSLPHWLCLIFKRTKQTNTTQKYQIRPAWCHTTKPPPLPASALAFPSSWYDGVAIPSFKKMYFSSYPEPEDTKKWFTVAAMWRSLLMLIKATSKWHEKELDRWWSKQKRWLQTAHLRNLIMKGDNDLLLSPKPWAVSYYLHLSLLPLPIPLLFSIHITHTHELCHLSNSHTS